MCLGSLLHHWLTNSPHPFPRNGKHIIIHPLTESAFYHLLSRAFHGLDQFVLMAPRWPLHSVTPVGPIAFLVASEQTGATSLIQVLPLATLRIIRCPIRQSV